MVPQPPETSSVDQAFTSFRQSGDPGELEKVFDATAPELLRLASHLVSDLALAEDLVQSTFVAAIQSCQEYIPNRPVLHWLTGILTNRAHEMRRKIGRRVDPARMPPKTVQEPPENALAAEFTASVSAAIAGIPLPYRPVLLMHLKHGQSVQEIALILERAPGTVRKQLSRGMEMLREALPPGLAVGMAALLTPSRGLASIREAVLAQASIPLPTSTGLLGVSLIMKKTLIALSLCVAIGLTYVAWPNSPLEEIEGPFSSANYSSADAKVDSVSGLGSDTSPSRTPLAKLEEPFAPLPQDGSGVLVVHVTWAEDQSPAAEVCVRPFQQGIPTIRMVGGHPWQTTDENGDVVFRGLPAGEFSIHAGRGGEVTAVIEADSRTEADLQIPRGIHVQGRIVNGAGEGIPDARIMLSHLSQEDAHEVGVSDALGSFSLRAVEPGKIIGAFPPGLIPTKGWGISGSPGDQIEVTLVARELEEAIIHGVVFGPDGKPLEGATVFVGMSMVLFNPSSKSVERPAPNILVRSDSEGRFRAEGVIGSENSTVPVWVRAVGCGAQVTRVPLKSGEEMLIEVHLRSGARVHGRVSDVSGNPIEGAYVDVRQPGIEPAEGMAYQGPRWGRIGVRSDSSGDFSLVDLEPEKVKITVKHYKKKSMLGADSIVLQLSPDSDTLWNSVPHQGLSIRGVLVDDAGMPMEGWRIIGRGPGGVRQPRVSRTDASGRFTLTGCDDALYQVQVHEADGALSGPAMTVARVSPHSDELRIEISKDRISSSSVTGRILDPDGGALAGLRMILRHADMDGVTRGGPRGRKTSWQGGRFTIDQLPPGHYTLEVGSEGGALGFLNIAPFELKADQNLDLGSHRFQKPGTIDVTMSDPDGKPTAWTRLQVVGPGFFGGTISIKRGRGESTPLQAGRHVLTIPSWIAPLVSVPVDVVSGQATPVVVQVPNMVTRTVKYPAFTRPESYCSVSWYAASGMEIHRSLIRLWSPSGVASQQEFKIAPGEYWVVVTDLLGRSVNDTFTISESEQSDEVLVLPSPFVK